MPSDANGVFSLPAGYLAVTGETIQASQHNPPLEDLASAMSARLMRSGAAPMTGPLKLSDGSAGAPAVQFNSDGTTGFYKTTNGVGVAIAGAKVAEFTANGASRMIGEIISWTRLTVPSGFVFPYGQTLSRTSYPELWTIAQEEIAAGNAFFNNGNGSTTFGIGDLRGRVIAGKDNMGGVSAARLTGFTAYVLGTAGGEQTTALAQANLPAVSPTFDGATATVNVVSSRGDIVFGTVTVSTAGDGSNAIGVVTAATRENNFLNSSGSFKPSGTISALGSGTAHNNVQPTMVCNFLLYVGA